jgi:hypothetical protein
MSDKEFLIKQNSGILAQQNDWSTAYAEGYLEGRYHQRLGKPLGTYVGVGIDDYPLGYRAGYFERKNAASTQIHTFNASEIEPKLQSK